MSLGDFRPFPRVFRTGISLDTSRRLDLATGTLERVAQLARHGSTCHMGRRGKRAALAGWLLLWVLGATALARGDIVSAWERLITRDESLPLGSPAVICASRQASDGEVWSKGVKRVALEKGLVGHWKLDGDCKDYSGNANHGVNDGAHLAAPGRGGRPGAAARFDGRDDYIEVPSSQSLSLGSSDFSISVWVHTDDDLDDVIGDIVSKFDPESRRGFGLSIMNNAGVTSSQPNYRNVFFGIDNARTAPQWTDCGRPGNNIFVCALAVHQGALYAGTFETGEREAGHVYRYAGGNEWVDCGGPDNSNSVFSLAVFKGQLYAGTARYRARGSALPDSLNQNPGGWVYRYKGEGKWIPCGRLGEANEVYALAAYRGAFYAIPMYSPGVFRLDGEDTWTYCGTPGGRRSMALAAFNGSLYCTGNEGAGVWRYEGGTDWTDCGQQDQETQTYSMAFYQGRMYAGTWPSGTVFRYDGGKTWIGCGRLGDEKEVMCMAVYNGMLYAGTLPLAQVYRYDGGSKWTLTGQLDTTPDVTYRRAWSMAVYQGKLYAGTLPSGHVLSLEAGKSVTYDHELGSGWKHIVAVRDGDRLRLYVDGKLAATSSAFNGADFDISNDRPLKIGMGAQDYFNGSMSELRIYSRALTDAEVAALHGK